MRGQRRAVHGVAIRGACVGFWGGANAQQGQLHLDLCWGVKKKKPVGPKPEPRRSPQVPLISGFYRDSLIEERGEGTITLMTLGFLRKYKEPLGRSKAITSCTLLSLGDTRRGQTPQINVLSCTVTFGGGVLVTFC